MLFVLLRILVIYTVDTIRKTIKPQQKKIYPNPRSRQAIKSAILDLRAEGHGPTSIVKTIWPDNISGGGEQFYTVINTLREFDPIGFYDKQTPSPLIAKNKITKFLRLSSDQKRNQ